jgi:hypothetical protein
MDFVNHWAGRTGFPAGRFVEWLGIHSSKFYHWIQRYGKANKHNA